MGRQSLQINRSRNHNKQRLGFSRNAEMANNKYALLISEKNLI
uniref:Uncharacterized protein n=1 Tax=Rhizophora mucronata TaxID=61149 RepID=A0A2P2QHE5_RHIMU